MGLTVDEMHARHEMHNLLDAWHGKRSKGDHFPFAKARIAALKFQMHVCNPARNFVIVGNKTAQAFGLYNVPYFRWVKLGPVRLNVAVVPHPSGIVRWWNRLANVRKARKFLRSL